MKNIHVIPTDKPSRLVINNSNILTLGKDEYTVLENKQNICITSDGEIKEGDWFLPQGHINPHKLKEFNKINGDLESYNGLCYDISKCKKIILTTDQDLIKDGVQSIPDEFLEWFCKNSCCEEVEVPYDYFQVNQNNPVLRGSTSIVKQHKITIPKEEFLDTNSQDNKQVRFINELAHELKQKTIEGAAEIYVKNTVGLHYFGNENSLENLSKKHYFIEGARWQQERSFDEKEVWNMCNELASYFIGGDTFDLENWFEQFKKK